MENLKVLSLNFEDNDANRTGSESMLFNLGYLAGIEFLDLNLR